MKQINNQWNGNDEENDNENENNEEMKAREREEMMKINNDVAMY